MAINAAKYGFQMPKDTLENPRIMLAVHDYAPVEKCLNGTSRENNDITLSDVISSYESISYALMRGFFTQTDINKVTAYMGYASFLNAKVGTENCKASLRYYSENASVATVSAMGKIVGVSVGSTNIVIASSTGYSVKVPITVENAPTDHSRFRWALHIYYNDKDHEFYDDVMSTDVATVQGPGQYCVKFDCATDLTSRAKEAGVTTINNAGAIYLKDVDVDEGKTTQSFLKSGNISYQCIRINGQTIAIADKEKTFPLVKSNHIIDTNNPINSWGDYAIVEDEVKVADNRITYKKVPEPTVIEVYFTLSDMYMDDGTAFQSADGSVPSVAVPTDTPEENAGDGSSQTNPTETPGDGSSQTNPTETPGDGGGQTAVP